MDSGTAGTVAAVEVLEVGSDLTFMAGRGTFIAIIEV
jgi:hypothetical protein